MSRPKQKPPTETRVINLNTAFRAMYMNDLELEELSEEQSDVILYFAYEKADLEDIVNAIPVR